MPNAPYDRTTPGGILNHARKLLGKSLHALYPSATPLNTGKGGLGQCVEVYHFGYSINNVSEADALEGSQRWQHGVKGETRSQHHQLRR